MPSLRIACLPVLALIAACGQGPGRDDDGREAEGEVLGGSISDDMLPLDQVRSQSPVLRDMPATAAADDGTVEGDEGEAVAEGDVGAADAEQAPTGDDQPPGGE